MCDSGWNPLFAAGFPVCLVPLIALQILPLLAIVHIYKLYILAYMSLTECGCRVAVGVREGTAG